jgi:cohesin complex subunit SA-1/2
MELSSPEAAPSSTFARRKSGRVVKKPEHLAAVSSPAGSVKRKRTGDDDGEMDDASEDVSSDETDGEPDEEELREKRRTQQKKKKAAPRQPAPKRTKTNGEVNLAIRPAAAAKPKKRKTKAANVVDALDAEGLYGNPNFLHIDAQS